MCTFPTPQYTITELLQKACSGAGSCSSLTSSDRARCFAWMTVYQQASPHRMELTRKFLSSMAQTVQTGEVPAIEWDKDISKDAEQIPDWPLGKSPGAPEVFVRAGWLPEA